MVPPPITPIRFTSRGVTPFRSSCCAARRSEKKAWIIAARSGVCIRSMKARRSTATPSANGSASPSAIVSSARSGATCPREALATLPRQLSTTCGSTVGAATSDRHRPAAPSDSSRRACAIPAARGSVPSASASIRFIRNASSAPIWRPDVTMSIAASSPTARGSRWVPPAPGNRPSVTSGRPSRVPGTATRAWAPSATSSPPPSTVPCSAATIGLSDASIASMTSGRNGATGGLPNSDMSAPAMKVRPAQQITAIRAPSSVAKRATASDRPRRTAADSAFTGGLSISIRAISPSRS